MPGKTIDIYEPIKELRQQFNTLRVGVTLVELQDIIDVPRARLANFGYGGLLKFPELEKIQRWCEREAHRHSCADDTTPTVAPGVTSQP